MATGYTIQNPDGSYPKSASAGTPIWWSSYDAAWKGWQNGYGASAANVVKVNLRPSPFGYNGYSIV